MILNKSTYLDFDERIELRDIILNNEELKNHAEELGKIHEVSKKTKSINALSKLKKFLKNKGVDVR